MTQSNDTPADELAVDSGMDAQSILGAEAFWANLPTGRKWASLKTYEKALVCHQMDRLEAAIRNQPSSNAVRNAVIEECAAIAEQYEHAWGEGNNPVCGLVATDIRALAKDLTNG